MIVVRLTTDVLSRYDLHVTYCQHQLHVKQSNCKTPTNARTSVESED
jgi:hypothetical protein